MSTAQSQGIEVELLGDIRFRIGERVCDAFPYDKVRALFALVATGRGQALRREWLASLLWPQLPAADGRRNLRIALAHLNKLQPSPTRPWLLADRLSIRFAPGAIARIDVDFVEQAPTACGSPVDAGVMIEALRRYRGPFLGSLALPGNAEFDAWAGARREACQRRAIAIAEGLAAFFHAQGAIDRALEYTERAFDLDRERETGHRRLIELLAASGRHVAARAQYQAYERLLTEQVGGAPHREALALRARIDALASAATVAEPAATATGFDRRHVTVLHVELLCAPDDDSEDAALRHEAALHAARAAVARHGGHGLLQGTGLLAYFGYPTAREQGMRDALHAARAAVTGAVAAGAAVRCALHSGTILCGREAARPDVLGGCTRIAIGLCAHAEAGGIVVSAAARRLLDHALPGEPVQADLGMPGAQPVLAFRLSREAGGEARGGRSTAHASPFVGRAQELAELAAQWAAAQGDGPRLVLVRGEPGVGKSRLLAAFGAGLRAQGATVHEAGCDPRHGATPYFPVIGLLAQVLGLNEADGAAARRDKVRDYLGRGGPWGDDAEALLAYLLGIDGTDQAVSARPAQQLRDALENLLIALFTHGGAGVPLALVIEDVHWADPSTLALIGRLRGACARPAAMLLLTARPGFAVPWSSVPVLELGPLPAGDTEALVSARLGAVAPAAGLVARIVEASDGVPLYAEEMARMVAAGHPWETIPPTLQDVLAARLEVVGSARAVACMAATIGREFSPSLLAAALPEAGDLHPALARLCAAGLIEAVGEGRHRFRHALVQEAAYRMQGERARRAAHAAVAAALRGAFAARAAHEPAILAHHLAGAGHAQEAVECWLRAARSALARAANLEAIAHAEAGLARVDALPAAARPALELTLRIEQGTALLATAGYGSHAAAAAFAQAHGLLDAHTGAAERFRVLWGVWMGSSSQHGYREALKLARRLHRLAVDLDQPAFVAASHYALGNNLFWLARFAEAQAHFEAAAGLVELFPHREAVLRLGEDPVVTSLAFLGWVHWFRGRPQAAVAASEEALALGRRHGHPHSLSFALTLAAVLHRLRDDPARVAALAQELLALAEARGLALWAATGTLVKGWALAR